MRHPDDWPRVRSLFDAALDLPRTERERLFEREHQTSPAAAEQAQRLVDLALLPASVFDRGAAAWLESDEVSVPTEDLCGRVIGALTFVERIGEGGMSDVYLGQRGVAGSEQRVAIKVLKRGLDTDGLLRRFAREQQALAALAHPRIVTLLDAGALPDGRPFFVMEHVEGRSLCAACQDRELGPRERVRVFLKVCEAVTWAHRNLVLHRDLKPSNILMTREGSIKLLDFGVAKLLQGDADEEATQVTELLQPLTLAYASPEQVRGERVSVATDVYSLGLILHELLTGKRAFEERSVAGVWARTGEQPALASQVVRDLERDAGPAESAPARVRARDLRGDLDAIVQQATSADPARRYASVEALARDLTHYVAGEPVAARRSTFWHRGRLALKRKPLPYALAAGALLALVTGLVGTWLGKLQAQAEAGAGWGAHSEARRASAFFESLLVERLGSDSPRGWQATLDAAEEQIAEEFGAWPETEALARIFVARASLGRGDTRRAARNLERALDLSTQTRGLGIHDRARAARLLGEAQYAEGDARAAISLERAIQDYASLRSPDTAGVFEARLLLVSVLMSGGAGGQRVSELLDELERAVQADAKLASRADELRRLRAQL